MTEFFTQLLTDPTLLISLGLIIVSDIIMFVRGKRAKARTSVDVQALLDQVAMLITLLKGEPLEVSNVNAKQSK